MSYAFLEQLDVEQIRSLWAYFGDEPHSFISSQGEWLWSRPLWSGLEIEHLDDARAIMPEESQQILSDWLLDPAPYGVFEVKLIMHEVAQKRYRVKWKRVGAHRVCKWVDQTQNDELQKELHFYSTHDSLTSLYNRSFFDAEMTRHDRGRSFPISILCMDLASLRPVNNALGHDIGDLFIKQAARVLQKTFRGEDIVCRVAGGEFVALLPNTGAEGAHVVLERIRANVEQHNQKDDALLVYFAMGFASVEGPGRLKEAYKEADRRMQAEKTAQNLGRV